MPQRSITHGSFTIERVYTASPARVFAAFADPTVKQQWFRGPDDWDDSGLDLDFRVGGREHNSGGPKGEWVSQYDAVYHDIVPNERIVSTYDMRVDGRLISVSLATVELSPEGTGTHLTFTEHGAYLDDFDNVAGRKEGTEQLLAALERVLDRATANA